MIKDTIIGFFFVAWLLAVAYIHTAEYGKEHQQVDKITDRGVMSK